MSVFWVALSIISFFGVFTFFSLWESSSVYGEIEHTYNLSQTWILLSFYTFSYILIDNGMQMADSEFKFMT